MEDYKLVLRTLTAGATVKNPDGSLVSQNASEFMSYLNEEYLAHGYEIKSVDTFRVTPPPSVTGVAVMYEFVYHLVKELNTASKVK